MGLTDEGSGYDLGRSRVTARGLPGFLRDAAPAHDGAASCRRLHDDMPMAAALTAVGGITERMTTP